MKKFSFDKVCLIIPAKSFNVIGVIFLRFFPLVLTTLDEKESSTLQVVKNNQSILTKDYAGVINIYKVSSTKVLIESNNKYEIYNLENNKIQEITFNEDISGYKIRFLENNNLLITNDLDSKIIEITT